MRANRPAEPSSHSRLPKSFYKPRVIKNRGALLILLINLVVDSGQWSALNQILIKILQSNTQFATAQPVLLYLGFFVVSFAIPQLLYPLAGWLADARIGRYRVIRISIWCMWLGQCLLSVTLLPYQLLRTPTDATNYMLYAVQPLLFPVAFVIINAGLAGFQANALQFGIDQMVDSSGSEVSAFIHWYYWSNYFGGVTLSLLLTPVLTDGYTLYVLLAGINVLLMGCALLSWYKLKEWLIIEPQGKNPFKTMHDVIRFASNHKTPIYRSALTYWDDRPLTRLDLAKSKYGGPFTTEEVEDVKSFFAIIMILASLGMYLISDGTLGSILIDQMKSRALPNTEYTDGNLAWSLSTDALIFVSIPFYELVVYPIVQNCIGQLTILRRIGLGMTVGVVAQVTFIALYEVIFMSSTNANYCYLTNSTLPLTNTKVPAPYIAVPFTLSSIAEMLVYIAAFEFICAQSPYRFRGMLIGTLYALQGLCMTMGSLIGVAVANAHIGSVWKYGCGSVYYSVMLVISAVGLVLYLLAGRRYKRRERDKHIDHHMIAENYYSCSNSAPLN